MRSTANVDNGEQVQELTITPPPPLRNQSQNRPRLDTGGSTGSEGDEEVDESLTRIESSSIGVWQNLHLHQKMAMSWFEWC